MTTDEFKQQAEGLRLQLISVAQRYLGTTDEAEDIVQDTMVKLWLMREQLKSPISAFACMVTRNLCIDCLRRKHPTVDITQLSYEDDLSDDGEQIEQMLRVIDSLPSTQRTILQMHHLQGMKTKEIAIVLGSTEVAVRKTLSRARSMVASLLIGISMVTVRVLKVESSDECVAYIYGKKYTDQQTVMAEMKRTMGEMTEDNTQNEIEQQLNDLFSN